MHHDPGLAPPLDPERRDMVRAIVATIDSRLRDCEGLPFQAARDCLAGFVAEGIARRTDDLGRLTLSIFGIRVTTRGTDYAALCLWQQAAKDRLARIPERRT